MRIQIFFACLIFVTNANCQTANKDYPVPEYSNEVYFFQKDSNRLIRLEKGLSKLDTKTKMGGMGGMESGFSIDEARSPVRLSTGTVLHFVFSNGKSSGLPSNPQMDSAMKANGLNPSDVSDMMSKMNDPGSTTALYDADPGNNKRKIIMQSSSGMKLLGKAKKSSKKYTLSIKKIKDGYYEIVVDKILPRGEYSFVMTDMGSADMSYKLFAFGID